MLLAKRSLHKRLGSDAADWAIDQLAQGKDSPHLRQLAGFTGQENAFELEATFDLALRELGIHRPETKEAVVLHARELAHEYVDGAISQEILLRKLNNLYEIAGYLRELSPFFNLHHALDDMKTQGRSFYRHDATPENFDRLLREEIIIFLGPYIAATH